MFQTLEEAVTKYKELEVENNGLKQEKDALIRKRDELLGDLKKYKKFDQYKDLDIEELVQFKQKAEKEELVSKGEYEKAYQKDKEALNQRLAAIEAERKQEKEEREKEKADVLQMKIDTAAIAEYSKAKIINPKQLLTLTRDKLKLNDNGDLIVTEGYKELPPSEWLKDLRENPEYQHFFPATSAKGSGTDPVNNGNGGGNPSENPYMRGTPSWNMTKQYQLEKSNPQTAKRLQDEAKAAGKY